MATNIRSAHLVGSGVLVDITTSATVQDTRIRAIHATGVGTYVLDGTSTTPFNSTAGNIIKFNLTTTNDLTHIHLPDVGIRVDGLVSVTAPTSAATITVFYG